jgi:molecular chaperone GrpE (heat shock protein)
VDIPDSALDEEIAEPVDTIIPCVCQKLDNLAAMFSEKIQYDEQKEKAFSKLYEELDMFKNDFVERRMKEVYNDLFLLYDNVKSYVQRDDVQAPENKVARECLGYVIEEILEVLYRRGIERIIVDGDTFNPQLQRALKVEPAESPDSDGKVVRVVKAGFIKGNAILRHETVVVARWRGEEGVGE